MISKETIEDIKNRMDIYEVVSDFVQLKKAGSSYKALSPFTDERTPSFVVSPAKNIFKCFSTGKGGDPITFLMEVDGLSYMEALKYLAKKYGVAIEEEFQDENFVQAQNERESLFIILNFAKNYFVKNLWETPEGRNIGLSYFKERGFVDQTIKDFELGYALDQWQGLMDAAKVGGYNEDFLEKAGLKITKDEKSYDRFRDRVVFPIHNVSGKVIAFGARTLKSNEKGPKYINSPETELYSKSHILYGIFQAKNEIRNTANCFLVEGYTDVITLAQAGIKNVVASSGTSLTEDQIKLIKRYTENVTVLFDGDKAGIKASMRGIDMMLAGGLNVRAVPFPDGEDPDTYCKKLGGSGFKTYLEENSKDFITFKTKIYLDDNRDPLKRAESIREIVNSISIIPDPIKRAVYLQECSQLLGVEESTLITEVNKLLVSNHKEKGQQTPTAAAILKEALVPEEQQLDRTAIVELQEKESIRMLINYGLELVEGMTDTQMHLAEYLLAECEEIEFTSPLYSRILEEFKSNLVEGRIIDTNYLLNHNDDIIRKAAVDLSTEKHEMSSNWLEKFQISVNHERDSLKKSVFSNIMRLKFRIVQRMINENMEFLKPSNEEEVVNKHILIHQDLKKMEMSIAQSLGNVTVK